MAEKEKSSFYRPVTSVQTPKALEEFRDERSWTSLRKPKSRIAQEETSLLLPKELKLDSTKELR